MADVTTPWWKRWSIVAPLGGLVFAVAIQGVHVFDQKPRSKGLHLARAVPVQIDGWTERDLPLGANEFLSNEAEKVLNYDDVVYREFHRGEETFAVYVAYWGAGKMPTRLVASHTPDRCWTENGWRCLDMKFKQKESVDGTPLQPAEWRLFEPPSGGAPVSVLFWHLVEGRTYDYGERFNSIPNPILWWKDAVQQLMRGSREQYFIRLTSNERLETLWSDVGFKEVLRSLGHLGLVAESVRTARN